MDEIRGLVKKYLLKKEDPSERSFALIDYEQGPGQPLIEARLSARTHGLSEFDAFIAEGFWKIQDYKGQKVKIFQATNIRPEFPVSIEGSVSYLSNIFSSEKHGISKDAILKGITALGENSLSQLAENPDLLVNMSESAAKFRATILRDWARRTSNWKAVSLMKDADIEENIISKILDTFRTDTYDTIKNDPYKIVEIPSVEFAHADKLGQKLGINASDKRRLSGAMYTHLKKAALEGSTCIPLAKIVGDIARQVSVEGATFRDFLIDMVKNNSTEQFTVAISSKTQQPIASLTNLYRAEVKAANTILRMLQKGKRNNPDAVRQVAQKVMVNSPFDEYQREAVMKACVEPLSIITGGPGTGKSTILDAVIKISQQIDKTPIHVVAPTGKAAQRAKETTGLEATTLQMLLKMKEDPKTGINTYGHNRSNPLPKGSIVIVDEVSMMDSELLAALFDAIPEDGRIILQGDKDQLPSVGAGKVLADLIEANVNGQQILPVAELVNVYRQKGNSKIASDAKLINSGVVPHVDDKVRGGVTFIDCDSGKIADKIVEFYKTVVPQTGYSALKDVAVISPQAPGVGGTYEINRKLSHLLNPDGQTIPGIYKAAFDDERMPIPRVGDRVMLTENDHSNKVMNGDIGVIEGFKIGNKPSENQITVAFDCGVTIDMPVTKWRQLILAYAITCHKSQGSQYPIVIMPLSAAHKNHERTMLYTGWTRAQKLIVTVGEHEVLETAVKNHNVHKRNTLLKELVEVGAEKHKITPHGKKLTAEEPLMVVKVANSNGDNDTTPKVMSATMYKTVRPLPKLPPRFGVQPSNDRTAISPQAQETKTLADNNSVSQDEQKPATMKTIKPIKIPGKLPVFPKPK